MLDLIFPVDSVFFLFPLWFDGFLYYAWVLFLLVLSVCCVCLWNVVTLIFKYVIPWLYLFAIDEQSCTQTHSKDLHFLTFPSPFLILMSYFISYCISFFLFIVVIIDFTEFFDFLKFKDWSYLSTLEFFCLLPFLLWFFPSLYSCFSIWKDLFIPYKIRLLLPYSFSFSCLKFSLSYSKWSCWVEDPRLQVFPFRTVKISSTPFWSGLPAVEKLADSLIGPPCNCLFLPLESSFALAILSDVSWCVSIWDPLCFLYLDICFLL